MGERCHGSNPTDAPARSAEAILARILECRGAAKRPRTVFLFLEPAAGTIWLRLRSRGRNFQIGLGKRKIFFVCR